MKLAFPHMGNLSIAIAGAIRLLGGDLIVPPYNSKRTLSLGSRHSPESVCLPYKLVLGNYIEAIEAGADTLLMIDSIGICRLGQYSNACRTALEDMGHNVKFINFDLYKGQFKELYLGFKEATGNGNPIDLMRAIHLAVVKIELLDKLDHYLAYYRAREIKHGFADIRHNRGVKMIDESLTIRGCKKAFSDTVKQFKSIPADKNKDVLHVDITGEIYVVLDRFSNLDVEKELGKLGVHTHRQLNMSDWVKSIMIPSFLKFSETHGEKVERLAKEFLKRDVGGDAIESIGDTSFASDSNSDGVIHLLPFTCMPEIISQNILPNVRNKKDIPVLSLVLDEQMGKAGYVTRLEAFVDLIKRNKLKKTNNYVLDKMFAEGC